MDTSSQSSRGYSTTEMRRSSPRRLTYALIAAREKIGVAGLAIEHARRTTLARVRRSRLLRWRHRAPVADELLLAPPDLRPQDPSFVDEIDSGSFGLCGFTVQLRGASPFTVPEPSQAWARELHGFGWLRHFGAAWTVDNEPVARRLVGDWIAGQRRHSAHAFAPDVIGRRIISWLSHAWLLLDGTGRRSYVAVLVSLEDQISHLSAIWRNAPDGYPRLLSLIGLTQAALCIAGHERRLQAVERSLIDELGRQILPDGGHASRNSWVLVELLLDLLPLKQCFIARGIKPDPALQESIERMMAMLNCLRLGDGQLARFNGMGATERDVLATVLAYDQHSPRAQGPISQSGYVRLQRGGTVVVVDAGPPPVLELAGHACAGCLSFEMSAGNELLLVNGGRPGPAHERSGAAARGTASHNTLELNGQSSSNLVRNQKLERSVGAAPIRHPDRVTSELQESADGVVLSASHDGYDDRFNLIHRRTLNLNATGRRLEGADKLEGIKGDLRFARDIPFAVHFHLHPKCGARPRPDGGADLVSPSGERWILSASGAALTIEESTHYAEVTGPLQAQQVVLRGVCYGAAEVRWVLERADPSEPAEHSSQASGNCAAEAGKLAPNAAPDASDFSSDAV